MNFFKKRQQFEAEQQAFNEEKKRFLVEHEHRCFLLAERENTLRKAEQQLCDEKQGLDNEIHQWTLDYEKQKSKVNQ